MNASSPTATRPLPPPPARQAGPWLTAAGSPAQTCAPTPWLADALRVALLVAALLALALPASAWAAGTLQGQWLFHSLSGSSTADTSGNGHTLTLGSGQSLSTNSIAGTALVLPGSSGAQTAGAVIDTSASFTVSAWVRFDTTGCQYQTVVGQDGSNVSGFFLELIPPSCPFGFPSGSPRFEFMMLSSDSASATWYQAISSTTVQTGTWYHLAGVRDTASNTIRLYVNGVLEATTAYSIRWSANGRLGVGRSRWSGTSQDFVDGLVDSVRVYQGAMTAAEVLALSLEPMADWRTDESAYSGAAGEVLDNTGNGFDATRLGTASATTAGKVCGAFSVPSNTSTAIAAFDTGIDVDSQVGSQGSIAFWYRSATAWNGGNDAQLFDATVTSNRSFHLARRSNGSLRFSVVDSGGNAVDVSTSNFGFAANTWVHLAVTWRIASGSGNGRVQIYVNGSATTASETTSSALTGSIGTLYFGDNRAGITSNNATVNSANGTLDEVHLYRYVLSAAQVGADASLTRSCPSLLDHVEALPDATSALTCAPADLTLRACANADCSSLVTTYTGTVLLTTSSGRGDWSAGSGPAPQGTLANGTADDGAAAYTFVSADGGSARLRLAHHLAMDVSVDAVDDGTPSTARTSAGIAFRDNAFVFAEDAAGRIAGSAVVVAGRPHDMTLSLVRTDPATGQCGLADYSGSRSLKLWRSDSGGSWTAPSIASPALSVPAAQPGASNLTLAFSGGVASFHLATTDIGRYSLNARDDSGTLAAGVVSGSSSTLTVRPFALVVQGIRQGSTQNPGGSAATDSVFTAAGTPFQATVGAWRWTAAMTGNGTDADDDGLPDAGATLANTTAGGLAPSFAGPVTLAPLAASQTPAGGTLGTLANGSVGAFSGGSATPATLQYSEVGSFALATSGVVSNFLGSGLALDATVFNAAGTQATRVGRFTPARLALSGGTVTHRSAAACSPAAAFTYLGENFRLQFNLTAQNAQGGTTVNYTGAFARLDPTAAAGWQLAGVAGATRFSTAGASPRLALGSATGSWSAGVATGITLTAQALRASAPDGPFATAAFGIAPLDADGVALAAYDLDTDTTAGNDRAQVAVVPLHFGRLRLMNAIGAAERVLALPLAAQVWDGSGWAEQAADSCTHVPATAVSFGNLRRSLTAADTAVVGSGVTLAAGRGQLVLAAPAAGHAGTVDVALSLGSSATDASCLQPWTPGPGEAATAGAGLAHLRGAWCGSAYDRDPAARASFGLYGGATPFIQRREHY